MTRACIFPALLASCVFACGEFDPTPDIASMNVEKGLFDPDDGAFQIELTEPIAEDTLEVSILLDRHNKENELCISTDGELPQGCSEEAVVLVGPCSAEASSAFRTESDGLGYQCDGGVLELSEDNRTILLSPSRTLIPFERYVLRLAPGLSDEAGRARKGTVDRFFQIKGEFELAPTTFEPGFFFTVFDIIEPVPGLQFHFVFWIDVNPDTGEIVVFGSDLDPKDESTDMAVNRNILDWFPDPNPPTGAFIRARGQVADTSEGRLLRIFPFQLSVVSPRIEASDAELSGRFSTEPVEGAPGGDRELARGTLFSPDVALGDGGELARLGEGTGTTILFRLDESEAPELESILPDNLTLEEVMAAFDD